MPFFVEKKLPSKTEDMLKTRRGSTNYLHHFVKKKQKKNIYFSNKHTYFVSYIYPNLLL